MARSWVLYVVEGGLNEEHAGAQCVCEWPTSGIPHSPRPRPADHRLCMARIVCRSMQQRSTSFKLAFEESNLLVVGNKLLVVCRVIPAQPKQRKSHSMRAFMQQPLLGVVIFRGTLRSDVAVHDSVERNCE